MPKRKRMDIKKILATNPKVNAEQFAEALKILKELQSSGVQISGYNLEMPFSKGLRRQGAGPKTEDHRLVRVGRG